MEGQAITVDLDGRTYAGRFDVEGQGDAQTVSVGYQGNSISANSGLLRPVLVARTLLIELVRAQQADDARTGRIMPKASRSLHFRYGRHKAGSVPSGMDA